MLLGYKQAFSPRMSRELNRGPGTAATIGHMKIDVQLDHNFLAGQFGDAINALLSGVSHNLHLILNALVILLACTLQAARQSGEKAKPDSSPDSDRYQISIA
jgi:IS5 family transposase